MADNIQVLDISKIRLDGGTQSRITINPDTVNEYARLMRDGIELAPIQVFFDEKFYWLADGFHRVHAAKRLGRETLNAFVNIGSQREAILFSCTANASHGLRRTNADKRKAVETLLCDEEWSRWSDIQISRMCGVSIPTVTKYRKVLHENKAVQLDTTPSGEPQFSSLIKPSDNWNFTTVFYPRIDENNEHGYIPGDIYLNAFWYYVKQGDLVVDPMAGSGMAQIVYNDRLTWMGKQMYDFDLRLFDLTPQQPYIQKHNLLDSFPVSQPDYIFLDIPYFDIVHGAYSDNASDIANMGWDDYIQSLMRIAQVCGETQLKDTLCTVVAPNYVNWKAQSRQLVAAMIIDIWRQANYGLYDMAFSARKIQQTKTTRMAIMNNLAKENRLMLSDMSIILTFKKQI